MNINIEIGTRRAFYVVEVEHDELTGLDHDAVRSLNRAVAHLGEGDDCCSQLLARLMEIAQLIEERKRVFNGAFREAASKAVEPRRPKLLNASGIFEHAKGCEAWELYRNPRANMVARCTCGRAGTPVGTLTVAQMRENTHLRSMIDNATLASMPSILPGAEAGVIDGMRFLDNDESFDLTGSTDHFTPDPLEIARPARRVPHQIFIDEHNNRVRESRPEFDDHEMDKYRYSPGIAP